MTKAKYIDGFVLVVSKKNLASYKKMAKEAAVVARKFGALDYKECMGQDLAPSGGMGVPFTKLLKLKKGETVWYSFVTYKSRKHRDEINKKIMAYWGKKYEGKKHMAMPFDIKRVSMGGFTVEVSS